MTPTAPRKKTSTTTDLKAGSGTRRKVESLDAQDEPLAGRLSKDMERRVFALVTAVSEEDGHSYSPSWLEVVDAAKRLGYVHEKGMKLYLAQHGRLWLSSRAQASSGGGSGTKTKTMMKIDPTARLWLKDISRETGVDMQDAVGMIIRVIHENRDELVRVARAAGEDYPWDAVRVLLRRKTG